MYFQATILFCQQSLSVLNCKFLRVLIHTEKTEETIIHVTSSMFSVLLQTARGMLNKVFFTVDFHGFFSNVLHKRNRETVLYLFCSMACKKQEEQIEY